MTAFFSDLDRTLIFSHRIELPGEKLAVERLDGREQSYMTRRTLVFLQQASWLRLVPVTMRSREQYERISVFRDLLPCPYALICNGGVLLRDGEADEEWLSETRRLAEKELEELARLTEVFRALTDNVRAPMGLMAYALCGGTAPDVTGKLREAADGSLIAVRQDRGKVYCLPRSIHKGAALRRFRERFPVETAIAAGDSAFDIPMLEAADFAIVPRELETVRCARKMVTEGTRPLSDEICSALETLFRTVSIPEWNRVPGGRAMRCALPRREREAQ